ncbi:ESPR-type extended signal peptide-containing protein [Megasphaera hexanoica]|nr:ESPR-type extended signal peptide-containing protein [Megasphaera hexanoica]
MNRIYKVIWSKVKHQYVVVSELAHSCTKSTSSRVGRSAAAVLAALVLTTGICTVPAQAADPTLEELYYEQLNSTVRNDETSSPLVTLVDTQTAAPKTAAETGEPTADEGTQPGEEGGMTGTADQYTVVNKDGFYASNTKGTHNTLSKDGLWVGGTDDNTGFHVDNDGNVRTTGRITATSDAGDVIISNGQVSTHNENGTASLSGDGLVIASDKGAAYLSNGNLYLSGNIQADSGTIGEVEMKNGNIQAGSGTIGGVDMANDNIQAGSGTIGGVDMANDNIQAGSGTIGGVDMANDNIQAGSGTIGGVDMANDNIQAGSGTIGGVDMANDNIQAGSGTIGGVDMANDNIQAGSGTVGGVDMANDNIQAGSGTIGGVDMANDNIQAGSGTIGGVDMANDNIQAGSGTIGGVDMANDNIQAGSGTIGGVDMANDNIQAGSGTIGGVDLANDNIQAGSGTIGGVDMANDNIQAGSGTIGGVDMANDNIQAGSGTIGGVDMANDNIQAGSGTIGGVDMANDNIQAGSGTIGGVDMANDNIQAGSGTIGGVDMANDNIQAGSGTIGGVDMANDNIQAGSGTIGGVDMANDNIQAGSGTIGGVDMANDNIQAGSGTIGGVDMANDNIQAGSGTIGDVTLSDGKVTAEKGDIGDVWLSEGNISNVKNITAESGNIGDVKLDDGKVAAEKGDIGDVWLSEGNISNVKNITAESGSVGDVKLADGKVTAEKGDIGDVYLSEGNISHVQNITAERGTIGDVKLADGKVRAQKADIGGVFIKNESIQAGNIKINENGSNEITGLSNTNWNDGTPVDEDRAATEGQLSTVQGYVDDLEKKTQHITHTATDNGHYTTIEDHTNFNSDGSIDAVDGQFRVTSDGGLMLKDEAGNETFRIYNGTGGMKAASGKFVVNGETGEVTVDESLSVGKHDDGTYAFTVDKAGNAEVDGTMVIQGQTIINADADIKGSLEAAGNKFKVDGITGEVTAPKGNIGGVILETTDDGKSKVSADKADIGGVIIKDKGIEAGTVQINKGSATDNRVIDVNGNFAVYNDGAFKAAGENFVVKDTGDVTAKSYTTGSVQINADGQNTITGLSNTTWDPVNNDYRNSQKAATEAQLSTVQTSVGDLEDKTAHIEHVTEPEGTDYTSVEGTKFNSDGSISASAKDDLGFGTASLDFNSDGLTISNESFGSVAKTTINGDTITSTDAYGNQTIIDGGSVITENLTVNGDVNNTLKFNQDGLNINAGDANLNAQDSELSLNVDNGTGRNNAVKVTQDGTIFSYTETGTIGVTTTVIKGNNITAGDIVINGTADSATITGLSNTEWSGKVEDLVADRAATEGQLMTIYDNVRHIKHVGVDGTHYTLVEKTKFNDDGSVETMGTVKAADATFEEGSHELVTAGQLYAAGIVPGEAEATPDDVKSQDSIAIGKGSKADIKATAIGSATSANQYSVVVGHQATADGIESVAVGRGASASEKGAVALGMYADADAQAATALGREAKATAENAVALGAYSVADRADTVSVGSAGAERQITNVAAGKAPTDAVNVGQLDEATDGMVKWDAGTEDTIHGVKLENGRVTATELHAADGKFNVWTSGGMEATYGTFDTSIEAAGGNFKVNGTTGSITTAGGIEAEGGIAAAGGNFNVWNSGGMEAAYGVFEGKITAANEKFEVNGATGDITTAGQITAANDKFHVWGTGGIAIGEDTANPLFAVNGYNGDVKTQGDIVAKDMYVGSKDDDNAVVTVGDMTNVVGDADFSDTNYASEAGNVTDAVKAVDAQVKSNSDALDSYEVSGIVAGMTNGENGVAIGEGSANLDQYGVAIGKDANTDGFGSVAIGAHAAVTGNDSVAIGFNSQAAEDHVVSVGGYTPGTQRRIINVADGVNEHDAVNVGQLDEVKSSVSIVGDDLAAYKAAGVVPGTALPEEAEGAMALGEGAEVRGDSDNALAIGSKAKANSASAVAIGPSATANGSQSLAFGAGAATNGANAVAIGRGANSDADNAIALGKGADAQAKNAVAFGAEAVAAGQNSVALGVGSKATEDNVVSVGDSQTGLYRQITNAAAGTDAHDVVTVGQLQAASDEATKTIHGVTLDNGMITAADGNFIVYESGVVKLNDGNLVIGTNGDLNSKGTITGNVLSTGGFVANADGNAEAKGTVTANTFSTGEDGFIANSDGDFEARNAHIDGTLLVGEKFKVTPEGELIAANSAFKVKADGTVTANTVTLSNALVMQDAGGNTVFNVSNTGELTTSSILATTEMYVGSKDDAGNKVVTANQLAEVEAEAGKHTIVTANGNAAGNLKVTKTENDGQATYDISLSDTVTVGNNNKGVTLNGDADNGDPVLSVVTPGDGFGSGSSTFEFSSTGALFKENAETDQESYTNINGGTLTVKNVDPNNAQNKDYQTVIDGGKLTVSGSASEHDQTIINGAHIQIGSVQNGEAQMVITNNEIMIGADGIGRSALRITNNGVDDRTITGLTNKTLDVDHFGEVGRAATEEQLQIVDGKANANADAIKKLSGNGVDGQSLEKAVAVANQLDGANLSALNTLSQIAPMSLNVPTTMNALPPENTQESTGQDRDPSGEWGNNTTDGKTTTIGTDLTVTGNTHLNGDLEVDGNATFNDDVSIKGDLNMNGNKITGVKDGDVSASSTDAVNGSQLYDVQQKVEANTQNINTLGGAVNKLGNRIDEVGAGAAALAALHPLDFDPDNKWDFSAGYGNYRGESAVAFGAFYRPNEDTMFSVGGTVGNDDNMVNAGVSIKIGSGSSGVTTSRVAMAKEIKAMRDVVAKQDAQIQKLTAMVNALVGIQSEPDTTTMFPDVPENHWAYEAVAAMARSGLVKGYPDGEFKGDRTMTRYEFAQIIQNAIQAGAEVDSRLVEEFKPELEYFHIATVAKDKDGNPTIERVRAN